MIHSVVMCLLFFCLCLYYVLRVVYNGGCFSSNTTLMELHGREIDILFSDCINTRADLQ